MACFLGRHVHTHTYPQFHTGERLLSVVGKKKQRGWLARETYLGPRYVQVEEGRDQKEAAKGPRRQNGTDRGVLCRDPEKKVAKKVPGDRGGPPLSTLACPLRRKRAASDRCEWIFGFRCVNFVGHEEFDDLLSFHSTAIHRNCSWGRYVC